MNKEDRKYFKAQALAFILLMLMIATIVMCQWSLSEAKVESPPAISMQQQTLEKLRLSIDHEAIAARQAIIDYLKKSGSRSPIDMTYAIFKTKRPKLMLAMAVVESDGNYTVRNGGYKNMHHGAWQVNPKWWGEVPDKVDLQALQAEHIIDTYLEQTGGDLIKALNKYGGCSKGKYASSIMNEMKNVPNVL